MCLKSLTSCFRMKKTLVVSVLLLMIYFLRCDSEEKNGCPLSTPCVCLWDKNEKTMAYNKRNELLCSDKGLGGKILPTIEVATTNVTFFKLNLSRNHFDHVPVELVDLVHGVEFIDFTSNIITELPDTHFSLPNLRRFYLSGNKLSSIESGKFSNVTNLRTLLLDNNRLKSLKEGAFDGLTKLNHLTLSSNQLESIAPNVFSHLQELDYLSLHNNHLVALSSGTFNGLTSLHTLRLDKNQLKSLSNDVFLPLTALNRLDLDINKLEYVSRDTFKSLINLLTLYMGSNMLSILPKGFFSGMEKLTHLDLSKNSLSGLTTELFGETKFESLQWLNLAENKGLVSFQRKILSFISQFRSIRAFRSSLGIFTPHRIFE